MVCRGIGFKKLLFSGAGVYSDTDSGFRVVLARGTTCLGTWSRGGLP